MKRLAVSGWRLAKNVSALLALLTSTTSAADGLNPALPTLFIAGDSTAAKSSDPAQQGWAEPFAAYFATGGINVANRARGGRSSRTFITEGHWDALVAELKRGDFVLIQFGHNDSGALNQEPPGSTRPLRARGSIPGVGEETEAIDNVVTGKHEVVHTFGWYLRQMIADTRAHGATPILLSLTQRNDFHDGQLTRSGDDYRNWDLAVATSERVAFVDVATLIAQRYQALGPAAVAAFFPKDQVHTNAAGADVNAACVVQGLARIDGNPFARFLSDKEHIRGEGR